MFISRLKSLIGGKFSRWLKSREAHDPEAVYEAAISDRIRRYQQLKNAAAGAALLAVETREIIKGVGSGVEGLVDRYATWQAGERDGKGHGLAVTRGPSRVSDVQARNSPHRYTARVQVPGVVRSQ